MIKNTQSLLRKLLTASIIILSSLHLSYAMEKTSDGGEELSTELTPTLSEETTISPKLRVLRLEIFPEFSIEEIKLSTSLCDALKGDLSYGDLQEILKKLRSLYHVPEPHILGLVNEVHNSQLNALIYDMSHMLFSFKEDIDSEEKINSSVRSFVDQIIIKIKRS